MSVHISARDRIQTHCWAAFVTAQWAQRIGLKPGNMWEPIIVRHMEEDACALGNDGSARTRVTEMYARQLGVNL